jgi:hypothetical protein
MGAVSGGVGVDAEEEVKVLDLLWRGLSVRAIGGPENRHKCQRQSIENTQDLARSKEAERASNRCHLSNGLLVIERRMIDNSFRQEEVMATRFRPPYLS